MRTNRLAGLALLVARAIAILCNRSRVGLPAGHGSQPRIPEFILSDHRRQVFELNFVDLIHFCLLHFYGPEPIIRPRFVSEGRIDAR